MAVSYEAVDWKGGIWGDGEGAAGGGRGRDVTGSINERPRGYSGRGILPIRNT